MADSLSTPAACTAYVRHYVVARLHHWRDHPALQTVDITLLDGEQEHILKALTLGLAIDEAWAVSCELIVAFAPYMERRGHWETWHLLLLRAITAAQRLGDRDSEIALTTRLAKLCQRQSKPQAVVYYYRRVLRLTRRTGNRYETARACSNLGFHYIDRGHWWRSEVLNCHALAIFEALESSHGQAHTHNHLGLLYIRQRRWPKAEAHLKSACERWWMMGDKHSIIYGYENLSVLYNDMKRPGEALLWLEKAYHQIQLTGEEALLGGVLSNMGMAYRDHGDMIEAESYLKQAEVIFHRYANRHGLAQVWGHLGILYFYQTKLAEASVLLQNSRITFRDLHDIDSELRALIYLIECEFATGKTMGVRMYLAEAQNLLEQHNLSRQGDFFVEQLREFRDRLASL